MFHHKEGSWTKPLWWTPIQCQSKVGSDVDETIRYTKMARFKLHWIEEPTSPDDILDHATIKKALNPFGRVAYI
eukprot:m.136601 g.136601  ORF g.136601 m.136601 type:complete len:74 (+) comp38178_c0_seq16:456-677(+)